MRPEIVAQLRGWAKGYGRVRLRRAIVLIPDDPATLPALREAIAAAGLTVSPLGDSALLVESAPEATAEASEAALITLLRAAGHAPLWDTKARGVRREA